MENSFTILRSSTIFACGFKGFQFPANIVGNKKKLRNFSINIFSQQFSLIFCVFQFLFSEQPSCCFFLFFVGKSHQVAACQKVFEVRFSCVNIKNRFIHAYAMTPAMSKYNFIFQTYPYFFGDFCIQKEHFCPIIIECVCVH